MRLFRKRLVKLEKAIAYSPTGISYTWSVLLLIILFSLLVFGKFWLLLRFWLFSFMSLLLLMLLFWLLLLFKCVSVDADMISVAGFTDEDVAAFSCSLTFPFVVVASLFEDGSLAPLLSLKTSTVFW